MKNMLSSYELKSYEKRYGMLNDEQVLAAARKGDSEAGVYLCFARYGSVLVGAASKVFRDSDNEHEVLSIVTDVWQDCHEDGWKKLSQHTDNIGAFLAGIARNKALKQFNSETKRYNAVGAQLPSNEHGEFEQVLRDLYWEAMAVEEHSRKLEQLGYALETLSETERYVLDCKFVENMGMAKIAEVLPRKLYPVQLKGLAKNVSAYDVKKICDGALGKLGGLLAA